MDLNPDGIGHPYKALDAFCRRKGSSKPAAQKKCDNNTVVIRNEDHFAVRLHQTDVAKVYESEEIILDSGKWYTVTTRDRINGVLAQLRRGTRLRSDASGVWYLLGVGGLSLFEDGMSSGSATQRRWPGDPTAVTFVDRMQTTEFLLKKIDAATDAITKSLDRGAPIRGWQTTLCPMCNEAPNAGANKSVVPDEFTEVFSLGELMNDHQHLYQHLISKEITAGMALIGGVTRARAYNGTVKQIIRQRLRNQLLPGANSLKYQRYTHPGVPGWDIRVPAPTRLPAPAR